MVEFHDFAHLRNDGQVLSQSRLLREIMDHLMRSTSFVRSVQLALRPALGSLPLFLTTIGLLILILILIRILLRADLGTCI